ncbi:MAG TPA: hypothetical protein VIM77_15565, partial [Mucilaginibacter sp.]
MLLILAFGTLNVAFAQQQIPNIKTDTTRKNAPVNLAPPRSVRVREGIFNTDPAGLVRTVEYDAATNRYILYERVGNLLYRPPQYLTFAQYLKLKERSEQRSYYRQLADDYAYDSQQPGFIPVIKVRSRTFEQIFGSQNIDIRPQGSAEMILAGQVNKNQNP